MFTSNENIKTFTNLRDFNTGFLFTFKTHTHTSNTRPTHTSNVCFKEIVELVLLDLSHTHTQMYPYFLEITIK